MKKRGSIADAAGSLFFLLILMALIVAPFFYAYFIAKRKADFGIALENFDLTDQERDELIKNHKEKRYLSRQHEINTNRGLSINKNGEFDRRSKAGKLANQTKEELDIRLDNIDHLENIPFQRLNLFLREIKLSTSSKISIVVFICHFIYISISSSNPSYLNNYIYSSGVSVAGFMAIYSILSIWFFISSQPVRAALKESVNLNPQ